MMKTQEQNGENLLKATEDLYRLKMNEAIMDVWTSDELKTIHQEKVSEVISQCKSLPDFNVNKELEDTLKHVRKPDFYLH
jgi:hypothetical protein